MFKTLLKTSIFVCLLLVAHKVSATNYIWTGLGGDIYAVNPLNWSPNGVPGVADSITLDGSCTYCHVQLPANFNVWRITLAANFTGTMTTPPSSIVKIPGGLYWYNGGIDFPLGDVTLGTGYTGPASVDFNAATGATSVSISAPSAFNTGTGLIRAQHCTNGTLGGLAILSGTVEIKDANCSIAGLLIGNHGTFIAPTSTLTVGTIDTHPAGYDKGTFVHNLGTIKFSGAGNHRLNGDVELNNLIMDMTSCPYGQRSITFDAADNLTIYGSLTLKGYSPTCMLSLISDVASSSWKMWMVRGQSSVNMQYAKLTDACSVDTSFICQSGGPVLNAGPTSQLISNNINWIAQ